MPEVSLRTLSNAAAQMMEHLGLKGQVDAKIADAGLTQWLGKPGGDDFHIVVTLEPMPKPKE